MISVPTDEQELITFTADLVQQCRVSLGQRSAYYRAMHVISKTGRHDGLKALINLLDRHLKRTAAHIFSPVALKFAVEFDHTYDKKALDRAKVAALQTTRQWERSSTDLLFGRGVFEALKYGGTLLKQWAQSEGPREKEKNHYYAKLVQPWQFGVYNEAENDISKQIAMVETATMTLPEVWRRIWHMPNAVKLFNKIKSHAAAGQATADPQSYFHQVLSTSQLQTSSSTQTVPGGMVNLTSNANFATMGPQVAAEVVSVHELWVQDDDDYTTILMVEPDIIISPPVMDRKLLKKSNLLGIPGLQPYRLIQPNEVTNWFWGESELDDLVEPSMFLASLTDDARRLIGVQVDKILFFVGDGRITDEMYGQMRLAGYGNLDPNSKIEDMTPQFPAELLPLIQFVIEKMNSIGGFPPIMQGEGDSGVRAGTHAGTLLKTGAPTLRDRSLIVERQCAVAADLTLTLREAKDDVTYHTKGDSIQDVRETAFQLTDLPDDWQVTVDSHSSSPIFADEATQLIMALHAKGGLQTDYVIDNTAIPNREDAKAQNREAAKAKKLELQELLKMNPEVAEKVMLKQLTGGKR